MSARTEAAYAAATGFWHFVWMVAGGVLLLDARGGGWLFPAWWLTFVGVIAVALGLVGAVSSWRRFRVLNRPLEADA